MTTETTCPLCKGRMAPGRTDLTFRRDRSVVVVQGVPALVCEHCGEASLDTSTSKSAYDLAEREMSRGVALEFCTYAA
jgi:YgiT-type zinc finger domain-containing protein